MAALVPAAAIPATVTTAAADPRIEIDHAARALADAMACLHGEPFVVTVDHKSAFVLAIPKGGRA